MFTGGCKMSEENEANREWHVNKASHYYNDIPEGSMQETELCAKCKMQVDIDLLVDDICPECMQIIEEESEC